MSTTYDPISVSGITPKEKFDAAVNVIHSLPKNVSQLAGSFQPSHSMMLSFYAYYKQATEGKCNKPRPSFWDVINKAKWDAWNKLGDMPKEEAMINYVDDLKKIIETMPQTDIVSDFVEKLGNFYEIVDEHGQTIIGGSNTPNNLYKKGKILLKNTKKNQKDDYRISNGNARFIADHDTDSDDEKSVEINTNGNGFINYEKLGLNNNRISKETLNSDNQDKRKHNSNDTSDDEFCDTSQDPIGDDRIFRGTGPFEIIAMKGGDQPVGSSDIPRSGSAASALSSVSQLGQSSSVPFGNKPVQRSSGSGRRPPNFSANPNNIPADINERIAIALARLQHDMNSVLNRLNTLESLSKNKQRSPQSSEKNDKDIQSWWPFSNRFNLTKTTFILVWPFIAHFIIRMLFSDWFRKIITKKKNNF